MKILFTANIAKHIIRFHLPYLKMLKESGFKIHVACNGDDEIPYCDEKHLIPFQRSPFSFKNITAYFSLKKLIDSNNYCLIHCHTPISSLITRLASRMARSFGTKVLYTAHGLYFSAGSPIIFWIIFYPIEKFLSRYTDCIITINNEDFNLVKSRFFCPDCFLINGVGVEPGKFLPIDSTLKNNLRIKYGYLDSNYILIYVAEFTSRKNHKFLVNAASLLKQKIPDLKILFVGRGPLEKSMKRFAEIKNVSDVIDFLGYRTDIENIIPISDIGITSSKLEGLATNVIEEMLCGLPVVATRSRGHIELIDHGVNGFLFEPKSTLSFCNYIIELFYDNELRLRFSKNSIIKSNDFLIARSLSQMSNIYYKYLNKLHF